ncbi:MAG: 3-phosphoserine/phosphohydroxythreonine transaminase [Lachnospiraceae bacterium]|nr:3-phosphoserine/phosphohydroxythreonine transaminase [Lachnospiraceae bacterium]
MERVLNFAAGPATMPIEVLSNIQKNLCNYNEEGLSVMEMSHRSKTYDRIINDTKNSLKAILNLDDNFEILFLQGGASTQFAMIPLNLADENDLTYYAVTGNFASKAFEEAKKWTNAVDITNSKSDKYKYIPEINNSKIDKKARYLHITANNTIFGTMYDKLPEVDVPLVADVSSNVLGKDYDYTKFALAYAGAQKNLGPAGLTVVIINKKFIREDLSNKVPTMLRYDIHAKNNSMYNTPPTFAIYVAGEMFKWVMKEGGVKALEERNIKKARLLYDILDNSTFYIPFADKKSRSIMNVTFNLPTEELEAKFVEEARNEGMINLKGHRVLGGIRASIYNAMTFDGVKKLAEFMQTFEKNNR